MSEKALSGPKPGFMLWIFWTIACIPACELALATPKRTAKLETTTSFAEMPDMSATTICHIPRPAGTRSGTRKRPIAAPKLSAGFSTSPRGPKFNTNHITMDAIKIVVPALDK